MSRFFLNALRESDRQLPGPDRGVWRGDATSGDFLSMFAHDILIKGQLADPRLAHSVPSAFARPVLFAQAMSDSEHPLHEAIVSEWRGALALFALKPWYEFTIGADVFKVPPLDKEAESEPGGRGIGDLNLMTILRNQMPFSATNDWEMWWVLSCNGELVGATSPWTMVYTAAQYHAPAGVPWRTEEGLLCDPIRYFDPRKTRKKSEELALLFRWVTLVAGKQPWDMPKHLQSHAATLNRELTAWKKELAPYALDAVKMPALSDFVQVKEAPYDRFLMYPEKLEVPVESDLLLKSERLGSRNVLALSRKQLKGTERAHRSVLVSQIDLEALPGPSGKSFQTLDRTSHKLEYVFAEEAFFPPKLVELNMTEDALDRGVRRYAIPLTPKFFEYFSHDDLTSFGNMLSVGEAGRAVVVTLRVPLRNGDYLTVEKPYSLDTDVVPGESPTMALWPDFYAEDWQENLAAYAGQPERDLRVAPLVFDGTIGGEESSNRPGEKMLRIWRSTSPLIGFALRYRDGSTNQTSDAGVLLLKDLKRAPKLKDGTEWRVGVDFGTSNTTISVSRNNAATVLLPLEGRVRVLTTEPGSDRDEAVANHFARRDSVKPPFRTLLYETEAETFGEKGGYTLSFQWLPQLRPVPDVKWGARGGTAEDQPLAFYLRALVRRIVAEARAEGTKQVRLFWSYPLALPATPRQSMTQFWTGVSTMYSAAGAMSVMAEEGVPESDAVCRCLAKLPASVFPVGSDTLTVTVDVGGGSTDIAFWSENTMLEQLSFKLAGNDVHDARCQNLEGYIEALYAAATSGAALPANERRNIEDRFSIYVNHLLTQAKDGRGQVHDGANPRFHPAVLNIFGGPFASEPWLQVRTIAYALMCGVCYYIGLHARRWPERARETRVYFGGRGSSLISWVTNRPTDTQAILSDAFREGLLRDNIVNAVSHVQFYGPAIDYSSQLPSLKHETALGLLMPELATDVAPRNTTIVGEVHWTRPDGTEVDWDTEMTEHSMSELKPPKDLLRCYIASLLEPVLTRHKEISVDAATLAAVRVSSAVFQESLKRAAATSTRVLQPLFATELKGIIDQYVDTITRGGVKGTAA